MATKTARLAAAVEHYFTDLHRIRASGSATGERSSYGPLANLLNAIGGALKPKVFCVGELADQGAGHPDFGLYSSRQVQKGKPRPGQTPERGVVEVKSAEDDAWLTAHSRQGQPLLGPLQPRPGDQHPRLRARRGGLGAPSHQARDLPAGGERRGVRAAPGDAAILRPRHWRRPGRVPGPGAGAPRGPVRAEGSRLAVGLVRPRRAGAGQGPQATHSRWRRCALPWRRPWGSASRASAARPFSDRPWCRPLFYSACSPPGCCGPGKPGRVTVSTGVPRSGTCAPRSCGRSSTSSRAPATCSAWTSWR